MKLAVGHCISTPIPKVWRWSVGAEARFDAGVYCQMVLETLCMEVKSNILRKLFQNHVGRGKMGKIGVFIYSDLFTSMGG